MRIYFPLHEFWPWFHPNVVYEQVVPLRPFSIFHPIQLVYVQLLLGLCVQPLYVWLLHPPKKIYVCKKSSYVNLICFFRENGCYLFTFFFRSSSSRFWASSIAFCNLCSSARRASAANLSASSIALRSSSSSLAFIKSKKV